MFDENKNNITRKFLELKMWVNSIPEKQECKDSFDSINKGLFFVYAYGIYEGIVHDIISETIMELNTASIPIDKCIFELYSIIFSPEYDSLRDVGIEHKWEKRWAISSKMLGNSNVLIQGDMFPTDGKNLRYKQLEMIAKSFGLKSEVLPRVELKGFLDELVNNRNDIAHGNKLPKDVGGRYSRQELLTRCENMSEICSHICISYENYIIKKQYLRKS